MWIAAGTYKPHATSRWTSFEIPDGVKVYGGFAGTEAAFTPDDPETDTDEDTRAKDEDGSFTNVTILSGDLSGDDDNSERPTRKKYENYDDFKTRLFASTYYATRDDNSESVVKMRGKSELNGVMVTRGYSGYWGTNSAGVYALEGLRVTISHCTFNNNNSSSSGGAIYASRSTISYCIFNNNTASSSISRSYTTSYGGAIYADSYTSITHCIFTNNTAKYGGAIYAASSSISHCIFNNNTASSSISSSYTTSYSSGGAIYARFFTITHCSFTNNTATGRYNTATGIYSGSNGGAISGGGKISHCTFTNNSGDSCGGAIYVRSSTTTTTITHCTFTNNTTSRFGGGVYIADNSIRITLRNCIFWGNVADEAGGTNGDQIWNTHTSIRYKPVFSHCLIQGGEDAIQGVRFHKVTKASIITATSAAAIFVSVADGAEDLHLKDGSPAIDAGDNDVVDGADNSWSPDDSDDVAWAVVGFSNTCKEACVVACCIVRVCLS